MSNRSGTLVKESLAMVSVKPKVDFDSPEKETEPLRVPTWKTAKSCRVNFRENDPSVPLHCLDLLPNRIDVDSVTKTSHREKRTIYAPDQKATLEDMFRKKKFLTRKEEATLAAQLGININKVQTWFNNRRQKWRKEQKKGAVRPSELLPVLPEVSSIHTSCKRCGSDCFPQLPAQLQEPSQPLTSAPLPATFPLSPASHHTFTQCYLARLEKQLDPQQPLPVPRPLFVTEIGSLPCQQLYPPFPDQVTGLPQQQLESKEHVLQTAAAPSYTVHHSPPPVSRPDPLSFLGPMPNEHVYELSPSPVDPLQQPGTKLPVPQPADPARHSPSVSHAEPKVQEDAATDFKRVTNEFPFVYSFAKELPYIFGNLENDGESSLNSCCFENKEMSSRLPLKELCCGFMPKETSFEFNRQN